MVTMRCLEEEAKKKKKKKEHTSMSRVSTKPQNTYKQGTEND